MIFDKDFIGPVDEAASHYAQLIQYVGELDGEASNTDWQVRVIAMKCDWFSSISETNAARQRFEQYMVRNKLAIESCLNRFTITDERQKWETDTLSSLSEFGVDVPKNFLRNALLRRQLNRRV